MGLFRRNNTADNTEERSSNIVTYAGNSYALNPLATGYGGMQPAALGASRPHVAGNLESIVASAQPHSVMSAAVLVRSLLMSELYLRWRDAESHALFGSAGLAMYEDPRMREWLMAWSQMADYTGNAFIYRDTTRERLKLLRSEWVYLVLRSNSNANPEDVAAAAAAPHDQRADAIEHALDAEVIGYVYAPPQLRPQVILPEDMAHWKPEPHPLNPFLGASWVSSAVRELRADIQVDIHTDKFFEKGATPQLVFTLDKDMGAEKAALVKDALEDKIGGLENSWEAIYVGGGTDVKVVGSRLEDLGLGTLRGKLETRIGVRSRIPATILGTSEGMQGSAMNAGNYGQTRRLVADGFYNPHASSLCAALQPITPPPARQRNGTSGRQYLSFDPARVPFLQEDESDNADILSKKMSAIQSGWNAGFEPDAVVEAIASSDLRALMGKHSGLAPVQAQQLTSEGGTPNDV